VKLSATVPSLSVRLARGSGDKRVGRRYELPLELPSILPSGESPSGFLKNRR